MSDELPQPAVELTDGRQPGHFATRYPRSAWFQIAVEFVFLLVVLIAVSVSLLIIGKAVGAKPVNPQALAFGLQYPRDRTFLIWLSIALSGSAGGTAFALKWLYHSVAKWTWNRDRILWRFIVPALSGVFAVFVAFMVSAEIVPFLNAKAFDSFYRALGAGFLLGYFSDNVLAALQNLAVKWFGTVDARVRSASDKQD
ncbi:hypothetical protein [Sphingomonas sp. R86521]|uniref:hypothetical protein n=1 Tax=Sphingomonas sp. R86521 TaxID=3093860 RepID=UPI0036D402A0